MEISNMSFNRRYAISLFVLLGNLAIPFLFVLNKLRLVNELDFGLLATIYLALLLTSLAVSLSVFYCFSSRAAVRFNIYLDRCPCDYPQLGIWRYYFMG